MSYADYDFQKELESMPYETLVVNLFGGPDAGKCTLAHRLCADLAMHGKLVEYSPKYAKELVWEDRREMLDGSVTAQTVVASEQINRLNRLRGKVEIAITDPPPSCCRRRTCAKTTDPSLRSSNRLQTTIIRFAEWTCSSTANRRTNHRLRRLRGRLDPKVLNQLAMLRAPLRNPLSLCAR